MMTFSRFLAYIGGGSLILNALMGIYIYVLITTGSLRHDWQPIAGKLVLGNMAIVTVLAAIGVVISHLIEEEVA